MKVLVSCDLSQIESRTIHWLSGGTETLNAFRAYDAGTGPDLYKLAAGQIYQKLPQDVTKDERQVGKVATLALGFQGSVGALQNMCAAYNLSIEKHTRNPDGTADYKTEPQVGTDLWIVRQWRDSNPHIASRETGLWAELERAAALCVQNPPGSEFTVHGKLRFKRTNSVMSLRLPSGRSLFYWNPALKVRTTPFGQEKLVVTYRAEDAVLKRWTEFAAYGGLWAENAVQATARDIMAAGLINCDRRGLKSVLCVHDEIICEVDTDEFPDPAQHVKVAMLDTPYWAAGLPVNADAKASRRYSK